MGKLKRPPGQGPRHSAIASSLARRLAEGEWQTGTRIPSFRHLAKEYGVSLGTVQRAFKTLREEGKVRVTPDKPTVAALGVPLSELFEQSIALVTNRSLYAGHGLDWGQEIRRGIQNGAGKTESPLIVLHSGRWRQSYPAGLRYLPLQGILLLGPFKPSMLRQYEEMPLPVVVLDQPCDGIEINAVSLANFESAFDATTRMIARGHRQLAFLRRLTWSLREIDPDSKERQQGFIAACKKAGFQESQYKVYTVSGSGPGFAEKDLKRTEHPVTAILCVDDGCADAALNLAKSVGLRVPEDLSILSFTATLSKSPWTGPRSDFEHMGRLGVELLFKKRDGLVKLRVPTTWHDGETFGPLSKRK